MKKQVIVNTKLNRDEEELEQELQGETYVSNNTKANRVMWSEAVANYRVLNQTKQMTMRVDAGDLIKVKAKAKANNMPYQTLLKILFKQFAEGKVAIRV
jgi:predicted DNA binding CopG/RHH family protein